ncbi:MAG: phosphatase PAP2 family protein [Clostridia bacterium]|nr:phosphatase PAP2 family protein [Clostridia bacterium]
MALYSGVKFTAFMVIGRLVCGVHWFSDIFGGLIFSVAMILLYYAANHFIE